MYPYLTWGPLPRDEVLLSELLTEAGYDTALVTDNPQILQRHYQYDRGFCTRIRVRGQIKDRFVTDPVPVTLPCSPEKVHYVDRAIQFVRNGTARRGEEDYCPAQTFAAAARWLEQNARRRRVQAPSLLPLLRGETDRLRDCAVSSWSFRNWSSYRPSTVWTDEWALVYWRSGIRPELYHLPSDPDQRRDVYAGHRGVARELHGQYVRLLQQLETPAVHYWPRRLLWTAPWRSSRSELYPASRTV